MVSNVVLTLSVHVGQTHLHRGQLVTADATEEDLVVAGVGVPDPARTVRHQRNGKGEVVLARIEHDFSSAALEPVRAIVVRDELLDDLAIVDHVPGRDERLALGAEDLEERLPIARAQRADQGVDRIVERVEALLRGSREGCSMQAEYDRERERDAPHRRPPPPPPRPPPPPPRLPPPPPPPRLPPPPPAPPPPPPPSPQPRPPPPPPPPP